MPLRKNKKIKNSIDNDMEETLQIPGDDTEEFDTEYDEMEMDTVMISEEMEMEEYGAMSTNLSIKVGTSSVVGTRKYQQDSLYVDYNNGMNLGIVCDGMGGMTDGGQASEMAVKIFAEDFFTLMDDMSIPDFMRQEAVKMDAAVSKIAEGEELGSGTTCVAGIVRRGIFYWMSVGDSRIYIIRNGQIATVTRDHNLKLKLDAEYSSGQISEREYAEKMKQGEALISYIGIGNVPIIDVSTEGIPLMENDIVILCSDGLYKRLSSEEILATVMFEEPDMERAARRLTEVVMKRTRKSQDNTSVIVMQYNRYI